MADTIIYIAKKKNPQKTEQTRELKFSEFNGDTCIGMVAKFVHTAVELSRPLKYLWHQSSPVACLGFSTGGC